MKINFEGDPAINIPGYITLEIGQYSMMLYWIVWTKNNFAFNYVDLMYHYYCFVQQQSCMISQETRSINQMT